jgi:hypothetical protein
MGYLISGRLNVPTSMMKNMYYESVMVFNATFNNISAISWRSVLLVKKTGVPGENLNTYFIAKYYNTNYNNLQGSSPHNK